MQSLDMLHNIVQFDVAGADSLRISMILLCCYIIYIANLYFICSTVQFDVAGDEWRDVLKERIMDQVMFLLKFYFLQKFKYLLLFYNDNLWWQQFMTKTIYVSHFTDREILYAGRLCPLLQRGDNQIFSYEERNITNSWQSLKWSSRPSSSSPSSPSPPPSSSSPPPSPPGWPRRFQPVLLLLDRLHLLPRPDCHWQEQVSVIFFSTFHKQFVFVFVFVLTFFCICI